jgi:hypothetical protein
MTNKLAIVDAATTATGRTGLRLITRLLGAAQVK